MLLKAIAVQNLNISGGRNFNGSKRWKKWIGTPKASYGLLSLTQIEFILGKMIERFYRWC